MDSIVETHILEYHDEKSGDLYFTKGMLLAMGDRYEAQIEQLNATRRALPGRFLFRPTACSPPPSIDTMDPPPSGGTSPWAKKNNLPSPGPSASWPKAVCFPHQWAARRDVLCQQRLVDVLERRLLHPSCRVRQVGLPERLPVRSRAQPPPTPDTGSTGWGGDPAGLKALRRTLPGHQRWIVRAALCRAV